MVLTILISCSINVYFNCTLSECRRSVHYSHCLSFPYSLPQSIYIGKVNVGYEHLFSAHYSQSPFTVISFVTCQFDLFFTILQARQVFSFLVALLGIAAIIWEGWAINTSIKTGSCKKYCVHLLQ